MQNEFTIEYNPRNDVKSKKAFEKTIDDARKLLADNGFKDTVYLNLSLSFYYYLGKDWWLDYLSKHNNRVLVKFVSENKEFIIEDGELRQLFVI